MKHLIPVSLLGILQLFYGCGDHTASSVREQKDHYQLEIYDSIPFQFNYQDVRLTDQWRNEWYLGVNRTQPELHLYNRQGELTGKIPIPTPNPLGPGFIRGASFLHENAIGAFGPFGYILFDRDGRQLAADDFDGNRLIANINQWRLIGREEGEGSYRFFLPGSTHVLDDQSPESFAAHPFITAYHTAEKTNYREGAFLSETSPYLSGYLPMLGPLFDLGPSALYALFPHDDHLYTYDRQNLELRSALDLHLEHFGEPVWIPYGSLAQIGNLNIKENEWLSSRFLTLHRTGGDDGALLACFEAGLPVDQLNAVQDAYAVKDKYLVLIIEGEGVSNEVPLPAYLYAPQTVGDPEHILFAMNYLYLDETQPYEMHYLGRLKIQHN